MNTQWRWLLLAILLVAGCTKGGEGGGGKSAEPSANRPGAPAAPLPGDPDGGLVVVDSGTAGSVEIPSGTLSIDARITVQDGASLIEGGVPQELGLAEGHPAAGGSLIVTPDRPTEVTSAFQIAIALPPALSLTGDSNPAILYRLYEPGSKIFKSGLIPSQEIRMGEGKATFSTTRFGAFQLVFFESAVAPVSERVSAVQELRNASNTLVLDENGFGAAISSIENPARGFEFSQSHLTQMEFSGYCSVIGGNVEVSGPASGSATCLGNSWSIRSDLTLSEPGPFTVRIGHTREDGQVFWKTYGYVFGLRAATLTLEDYSLGRYITAQNVSSRLASGQCSEWGRPVRVLAGETLVAEGECRGGYHIPLDFTPIPDGDITLKVIHTNQAGAETVVTRNLIKKTTGALVTVEQTGTALYVVRNNASEFALTGVCSDRESTVTFSGAATGETPCHYWTWYKSFNLSALADGQHPLTVSHRDNMENDTSTTTVTLIKNTQSPVVVLPTTLNVTDAPFELRGFARNHQTLQWTVVGDATGVSFQPDSSDYTRVNVPSVGTYSLKLTATDGNLSAEATVQVTLSAQPPIAPSACSIDSVPGTGSLTFRCEHPGFIGHTVETLVVEHAGDLAAWNLANTWRPTNGVTYNSGQMISHNGQMLTVVGPAMYGYLPRSGLTTGTRYNYMMFARSNFQLYSAAPGTGGTVVQPAFNTLTGALGGTLNTTYVYNNHLFAGGSGGLDVYSIGVSAPYLTHLKHFSGLGNVWAIHADGNRLVVRSDVEASGRHHISIFDVTSPGDPAILKKNFELGYYKAYRIRLRGNTLYAMGDFGAMDLWDIGTPASPTAIALPTPWPSGVWALAFGATRAWAFVKYGNICINWPTCSPMLSDASGRSVLNLTNTTVAWEPQLPTIPDLQADPNWQNFEAGTSYLDAVKDPARDAVYAAASQSWPPLRITRYDVSNPNSSPVASGTAYTFSGSAPVKLAQLGDRLLAIGAGKLHELDVTSSDLTQGALTLDLPTSPASLSLAGTQAFLAFSDNSVGRIDVSTPITGAPVSRTPGIKFSWAGENNLQRIVISGNRAYVADGSTVLKVVDVTDHSLPRLTGWYEATGNIYDLQLADGRLYAAGGDGLLIFGLSNPDAPALLDSDNAGGTRSLSKVRVLGSTAIGVYEDGTRKLCAFDISDPQAISYISNSEYAVTDGNASDLRVSGTRVVVAGGLGGLHIVDYANPAAPQPLGVFKPAQGNDQYLGRVQSLELSGNYAYVTRYIAPFFGGQGQNTPESTGLTILNIANPAAITAVNRIKTAANASDLVLRGTKAYVASGTAGLFVIDISNPASLTINAVHSTGGNISRVVFHNNDAVVADADIGLAILGDLPLSP